MYGINIDDVWAGKQDVRHVLYLAYNLTLNPNSQVFAVRAGNPAARGWNATVRGIARLHNLIVALMSKKGADITPLLMDFPTGADMAKETGEGTLVAPTLSQFSEALFMKQMS